MNVLFITLADIRTVDGHGIYTDLIREFLKNGHDVYVASPVERRHGMSTQMLESQHDDLHSHVHILKVKTGNIQKTNVIEKGIATVLLEYQMESGIKKYFKNVKFDLILYSTPPITLVRPIRYIKKRDHARTYLMLKDIFPQNAVDLGMMSTGGLKGILYQSFRKKEKALYALSDKIGCMSQANVDYVLNHNPEIGTDRMEICPNCIEVQDMSITEEERIGLREKYGIPLDKRVFVYGGNLGKPQGIPFIIECLKKLNGHPNAYFLIVGGGTEFGKLQAFFDEEKPSNMKLMKRLPKEDYDRMIAACDVGLIFLDHRFTIPNFPSRLLAYMQAGLPVIACTDPNTDVGKVIVEGGFGWWCESNTVDGFVSCISSAINADYSTMRRLELVYLKDNFSIDKGYQQISRGLSDAEDLMPVMAGNQIS